MSLAYLTKSKILFERLAWGSEPSIAVGVMNVLCQLKQALA
jgi:hypothetical protein